MCACGDHRLEVDAVAVLLCICCRSQIPGHISVINISVEF
jgi:hypothetical protein